MPVGRATTVVNNYARQLAKDAKAAQAAANSQAALDSLEGTNPEACLAPEGGVARNSVLGTIAYQPASAEKHPANRETASIMEVFATDPEAPQFIHSRVWFKGLIALCVVLNAVQLGMELDYEEYKSLYKILDHAFTGVFSIEMVIKVKELHCQYFREGWNLLDFSLVSLSILDVWALPLAFKLLFSGGGDPDLRKFSVLRILRVLRVIRAVRLLRVFQELWKIVRGIMDSVKTIFWASLLLIFLLYICGIFCCAMIGKNDSAGYIIQEPEERPDYGSDFDAYQFFGTVPRSMFTLFETCIEPLNIRPVVERQPAMLVFFIGFIFLTTFGVLNVIIGVIVDHTMAQNDEDVNSQEIRQFQEKMDKLEVVRTMCFDENGDDYLSADELKHAIETPEVQETFEEVGMPLGMMAPEFFTLLDDNGDGKVTHQKMMMQLTRAAVHTDHQQLLDLKIANHVTLRTVRELAGVVEQLQKQIQNQLTFGFGTVLPEVVKNGGELPEGLMQGMRLAGLMPEQAVHGHLPEDLRRDSCDNNSGMAMMASRTRSNMKVSEKSPSHGSSTPNAPSTGEYMRPVPPPLPDTPHSQHVSHSSVETPGSTVSHLMTIPSVSADDSSNLPHPHHPQHQAHASPCPSTPSEVCLVPKTPMQTPPTLPTVSERGAATKEEWTRIPQNIPGWAGTPQSLPGPPPQQAQIRPPTGAGTLSPKPPADPPSPLHPGSTPHAGRPQSAGRYKLTETPKGNEDSELCFFTSSKAGNSPEISPGMTPPGPQPPWAVMDPPPAHPAAGHTNTGRPPVPHGHNMADFQSKPNDFECPELTPQPGAIQQPGASGQQESPQAAGTPKLAQTLS